MLRDRGRLTATAFIADHTPPPEHAYWTTFLHQPTPIFRGTAKIARRLLKWSIYLTISFWTGGAWIMYFADAPTLVREFWSGQAAPVAYGSVAVVTFTTFWLGALMRPVGAVVLGAYLDRVVLPPGYARWGTFEELNELTLERLHAMMLEARPPNRIV